MPQIGSRPHTNDSAPLPASSSATDERRKLLESRGTTPAALSTAAAGDIYAPDKPAQYCSADATAASTAVAGNKDGEDGGKEGEEEEEAYGVEPARFVVLLGLCLINACNMLLWITYSAIVTPSETRYGFNASDINVLNITYMAVYSGAFWLSGVILPRTGLGWGLVLSGLFNLIVTVMRLVTTWVPSDSDSSFPHYEVILAGNLIGGLCQVVVLCAPPMCSNQWFALKERNFATGMGAGAQVMGGALGALLPALIVTDGANAEFATLYWVQFGIAAAGLLVALIAKKKPTLPPTPGASKMGEGGNRTQQKQQKKSNGSRESALLSASTGGAGLNTTTAGDSNNDAASSNSPSSLPVRLVAKLKSAANTILTLLKIPSFVLIISISGLIQGTFWTAASLMMQIAEPYGVAQETVGWFGFTGQVVGGLGAVAISGVLALVPNYKPVLLAHSALALACGAAFPVAANIAGTDEEDGLSSGAATALAGVLYVGMSVFCITQVPILFELGIEETFPISEEVTSPFIMWAPSFFSVILIQSLGALLTDNPSRDEALWAMYIMAGIMLAAVALGLVLRLSYKRRAYEAAHSGAAAVAVEGCAAVPVEEV